MFKAKREINKKEYDHKVKTLGNHTKSVNNNHKIYRGGIRF